MVVRRPRTKASTLPDPLPGLARVESMNVLGVIVQQDLSFHEQVERLVNQCSQNMYALRQLKAHGLTGPKLWDVTKATLVSRLTYASQAWWGMLDAESRNRLEAAFNKVIKQSYLQPKHPSFSVLCDAADQSLFNSILTNQNHVLHHLLPPKKITNYNLRQRKHDRIVPTDKGTLFRKTFLIKMHSLNSGIETSQKQ